MCPRVSGCVCACVSIWVPTCHGTHVEEQAFDFTLHGVEDRVFLIHCSGMLGQLASTFGDSPVSASQLPIVVYWCYRSLENCI